MKNNFFKFIKQFNSKSFRIRLIFILTGIISTVWFLVRVIPKPQRAAYPCMRAAAPIMSSFVIWLLSVFGMMAAYKRAKVNLAKSKYFIVMLCGFAFLISLMLFMSQDVRTIYARLINKPLQANAPVGVERGIFPGRVVWVRDPKAVTWNFTGNWWDDAYISQTETDKMITGALLSVSGKTIESEAWDSVFKSFNFRKTGTATGYQAGQKIAIKINQNNTNSHTDNNNINGCPQLILSLLKGLINQAGVAEGDITVFDASRFITNNIYNKCHAVFPNVVFVDNSGNDGRVKSTYVDNAIPFSLTSNNAKGIATCAVNASYLINMAILKGHVNQGVTLCGKNWFGTTSISANYVNNAHDYFGANGDNTYLTFVDYMGHKDLGEKTVLFLIDALYASKALSGSPSPKWQMAPFNNSWPCSLFASQDGVAIDAVGIDFLKSEFPDLADATYADRYLLEASQANNPPSGTFYDPEKDGSRLPSLGVFEHWNNATDKKYSRNLGLNYGIELFQNVITDTPAVAVTGVSIIPTSKTIGINESFTIIPTVLPSNATNKSVTYSVISGNTFVIVNSSTGLVTGIAAGTATVRATTSDGAKTADCIVTVNNKIMCAAPAIVYTNTAPVIDKVIDAIWAFAPSKTISLGMNGVNPPAGFSAVWRSLYTSTNLYFLVEVTKNGTLYNQNGTNWWQDDAVEIFIDGNNSKNNTFDGVNDFQFGFRYNDSINIQVGGTNPANSTIGISYNLYTTAVGYNVEVSIPWTTLKTTPTNENKIGLEVGVDVSSGAARLTQMTTFNNSGNSYLNPSLLGTVGLSQCSYNPIATINLGNLTATYDGTAKSVTVTTIPTGLAVDITYNGSSVSPINAGTYTVVATVNDSIYQGSTTGTFIIEMPSEIKSNQEKELSIISSNGVITIKGIEIGKGISIYNLQGNKVYYEKASNETEIISSLKVGVYCIFVDGQKKAIKVLVMK